MSQPSIQPKAQRISETRCEVFGIPTLSAPIVDLPVTLDTHGGSRRCFTYLKCVHRSYRSDVWICKWDSPLRPKENTPDLLPMARFGQENRVVALKILDVSRYGEPLRLKELQALRLLPPHANTVTLYDYFFTPNPDRRLYMVLGAMEGNLYQLFKARKGRHFAGGLVSSTLHQLALGIDHLHSNGYFHRDLSPENILITTLGIFWYPPVPTSATASHTDAPKERDIYLTLKVSDLGLAQETSATTPYTEYVTQRWYRAPEVLLLNSQYTKAIDMWAVGVIAAEVLNLEPLFPGTTQIDQINKICELLGNPAETSLFDDQGSPVNGGAWPAGLEIARRGGFEFPTYIPRPLASYFQPSVPTSLISWIRELLTYDPENRLTSSGCLSHAYFEETAFHREIENGSVDTATYSLHAC